MSVACFSWILLFPVRRRRFAELLLLDRLGGHSGICLKGAQALSRASAARAVITSRDQSSHAIDRSARSIKPRSIEERRVRVVVERPDRALDARVGHLAMVAGDRPAGVD